MTFDELPLVIKVEILKPQIDAFFNQNPREESTDVDEIIRKYNLEYLREKEYTIKKE